MKRLATLAILVGLGVGGWYAYQHYYAPQQLERVELPTVAAEVRDIVVSVSATGTLQPVRVVDVKSKASGEILSMPVDIGDRVRAGDLVVQVDTRIIEQELRQAEADLSSAEVRAEIAERQYRRAQELQAEDLISSNDLESAEQNFKNSEAQLLRSQATVELARDRLADATVRAPIDGTVIAKAVEEGTIITSSTSNVSGGTTLVQMADLTELEVRTLVDEIDIGQVQAGLPVDIIVEAFPERRFRGQVVKIEPMSVVQQSVTTFPVLSRVANADGSLLPGMNAEVNIVIHRRPGVLAVPNEAVRTPGDALQVAALLGIQVPGAQAPGMAGPGGERLADRGEDQQGRGAGADSTAPGVAAGGPAVAGDATAGGEDDGSPAASVGQAAVSPNGDNGNHAESPAQGPGGTRTAVDRGSRTARGQGRQGFGAGGGDRGGRGGFDPSDPEARRRLDELRRRRQEAAGNEDDPWGVESGRRQSAFVFLRDAQGRIVAQEIVIGVRDWEYTEVASGLRAGAELVILPSTSLLRSQDDLRQRFSNRGGLPGIGGPPGGGRRFR